MSVKSSTKVNADVVIIGAGLSGLVAAYNILTIDPLLDVYVLEASSHYGGKIYCKVMSTLNGLHIFDTGDEFITDCQKNVIELCEKLNVELIPRKKATKKSLIDVVDDEPIKYNGNLISTSIESIELITFLGKNENLVENCTFNNKYNNDLCKELDETSMEDFCAKYLKREKNLNIMRNVINIYTGMEASKISVLFYTAFCNSTNGIFSQFSPWNNSSKDLIFKDGVHVLCNKLVESIGEKNICTNEMVTNVQKIKNVFIVTSQSTKFMYVIVSIPTYDAHKITFSPALPTAKTKMFNSMYKNNVVKFVVTYSKRFWIEKGLSGDVFSNPNLDGNVFSACFDVSRNNEPILCGFITLSNPQETKSYKEQVLNQLYKYFGEDALNPIDYEEFNLYRLKRAYNKCYPPLNQMNYFTELRKPVGRIFWCSPETATFWNGHLSGAIQSGYRAAIEVLYDVRPQALQVQHILDINPNEKFTPRYNEMLVNKCRDWKFYVPYVFLICTLYLLRKRIAKIGYFMFGNKYHE